MANGTSEGVNEELWRQTKSDLKEQFDSLCKMAYTVVGGGDTEMCSKELLGQTEDHVKSACS